jgi:hypothetical protein
MGYSELSLGRQKGVEPSNGTWGVFHEFFRVFSSKKLI